jgi:hypothetical protein
MDNFPMPISLIQYHCAPIPQVACHVDGPPLSATPQIEWNRPTDRAGEGIQTVINRWRTKFTPVATGAAAPYARQPWFSRTWIIAARMWFQVSCFIITSLGNMQPSQQMCLNFFVTFPLSSRSQ